MRTIGDTIKLLREERRLSQQQLANILNIARSTISMYESGSRIPEDDMKDIICDYFNVDMNYLYGKTNTRNSYREEKNENDKIINQKSIQRIPLYTSISCGTGLFVDDQVEDYIAVPDKFIKPGHDYFANTASGDSMIGKGIKEGDVLVFEKTNIIENGEIGAFCVGESEAVCKTFRKLPSGMILLESANEAYQPIEVDLTDECFRVIGKYKFKFSIEQ